MKRTITITACLITALSGFSQANFTLSSGNSAARYYVSNNGTFFHNPFNATKGYFVPADSTIGDIYLMGLEAFGTDVNGQLKGALGTYTESDFFPGPMANDYNDPGYAVRYLQNPIWQITKEVIDYHIAHWQDVNYQPPAEIETWPGSGDITNGEAAMLAPFFDTDNNQHYDPLNGDYPLIRGDKAVFTIVNDNAGTHPSGSGAAGMEAHLLFYQYEDSAQPAITQTTFINVTLINRGTQTLNDFHFGSLIDFDLGNPYDDYVGTMPGRNLAYVYNGDMYDDNYNNYPGYGDNPPAVGVMTLGKPLHSHVFLPDNQYPQTGLQAYYTMQGLTLFGNTIPDNNGQPTRYCYTETGSGWNESTAENPPGDRRTNISFDTETFAPGTVLCYDYAVVFARNAGDIFSSANTLGLVADEVAAFFEDQTFACLQTVLENDEELLSATALFPNPATNELTIKLTENGAYRIVTPDGKTLLHGTASGTATIDISALAGGYYLFVFAGSQSEQTISFLKQ